MRQDNSPLLPPGADGGMAPPAPQKMACSVPESFREGRGRSVTSSQAQAYSHSLPHQQLEEYRGCYTCHTCCGPVCCCYLKPCGDNCVYTPWCFLGIPVPVWGCICCACERHGNSFTFRGRYGEKTGELLFVDEEKKTLGYWPVVCCSSQLAEAPWCYFTKSCHS